MNIDWQDAVSLGLVVVAAIYVAVRLWRVCSGKARTGRGTCPNCSGTANRKQLVSIDRPKEDD